MQSADLLAFLKSKGITDLKFHHEFRVTMANCPNACSQPQIKDIGIISAALPAVSDEACSDCRACADICREAAISFGEDATLPTLHSDRCVACGQCVPVCPTGTLVETIKGYRVQLGGKLGRHPQLGLELPGIYTETAVLGIVADCLDLYKKRSRRGERFGELVGSDDVTASGRALHWGVARFAPVRVGAHLFQYSNAVIQMKPNRSHSVGVVTRHDRDPQVERLIEDRTAEIRFESPFFHRSHVEIEYQAQIPYQFKVALNLVKHISPHQLTPIDRIEQTDQIKVPHHLGLQPFDQVLLAIEIGTVERLYAANGIYSSLVRFLTVIEGDAFDMVDAADDVVGAMAGHQLLCQSDGPGRVFGFKPHQNLDSVGIALLQTPRLLDVVPEPFGHGLGGQPGGELLRIEIAIVCGRHMLGQAHPGETLVDVSLNNLLQRVLSVVAKLAAVAAVDRNAIDRHHHMGPLR